jgi:hypothetical protein
VTCSSSSDHGLLEKSLSGVCRGLD